MSILLTTMRLSNAQREAMQIRLTTVVVFYFPILKLLKLRILEEALRIIEELLRAHQDFLRILEQLYQNSSGVIEELFKKFHGRGVGNDQDSQYYDVRWQNLFKYLQALAAFGKLKDSLLLTLMLPMLSFIRAMHSKSNCICTLRHTTALRK